MYLYRSKYTHRRLCIDVMALIDWSFGKFKRDVRTVSTPVVSTRGEMRRNTGRAYEGRALWIFCKKLLQSKPPVVSAIAAIPAFPSTPGG